MDRKTISQLKHDITGHNEQREAEQRLFKDLQRENEVLHKERTELLTSNNSKERKINFQNPNATLLDSRMDTDTDEDDLLSQVQENINRSLRAAEKKMEAQLAKAIVTLGETISHTIQTALAQFNLPQEQHVMPAIRSNSQQRASRSVSRNRQEFRQTQRTPLTGLSYAATLSRSASKPET